MTYVSREHPWIVCTIRLGRVCPLAEWEAMSVSVLEEPPRTGSDLSDIFDQYVADDSLPSPQWLTNLRLERPRRNTRCLGETTRLFKRITDIVGASALLMVLWPVMLLVAVLVRLTSPGPIIFSQRRVGLNLREKKRDRRTARAGMPPDGMERRHPGSDRRRGSAFGKPFVLYKFRTMRIDAEKNGAQLATKNDPRVTPIGRFLRKTRLDELPQLWNVLKGEMSLVGPRPERPEFIETLSEQVPNYINRLGLKPGLTGLAQIINGYDTDVESFKRKVNLDLLYLQNCCLLNDLKILLRTVSVVLSGSGAH
ncbi:MAG: sugar transferase [Planctomycetaceae bacterium]|nr:sugar transferase [Planctomycetaceae bacterium]